MIPGGRQFSAGPADAESLKRVGLLRTVMGRGNLE